MNSAAEVSSPCRDTQSFRRRLIGLIAVGEVGVLAAMALLIAFFWLLEPAFLSERNIRAILNVVSFVGIIAIGQTILLVAGEFDLSVGSVAGLSAVVAAKLMTAAVLPVTVGILGGIGVGALIGLLNGLIVVRLGIPAFIQTLGMLFIGQGLIQVVTGGYPVYPLPEAINTIGGTDLAFGLGWSFAFFIIAAVAADFVLRRTVLGRNIYATGGNKEVAHLVGINTNACKIGAFITVGALSAIAG
ncbi:ABC transporter permease, partial [Mesorhizobium sp. M8A.F.Ca.ET.059.01.1.1]